MITIGKINEGIRSYGLLINPPTGYNLLWIRIPNGHYESFRLSLFNTTGADYQDLNEIYTGGLISVNTISPDGGSNGINNTL